jgi:branched-chain amino acid transport system substrate-binding protein
MINPYIAGAPVAEAKMFFGREDVFGWIERSLTGRYVNHILVVHGQRRVGKTSVLKQLPNHLSERYIPVFFDLQGRTHTTLNRFLWWLSREIARTLKQDRDILIHRPDRSAFEDNPEFFENQFLPTIRGDSNQAGGKRWSIYTKNTCPWNQRRYIHLLRLGKFLGAGQRGAHRLTDRVFHRR